MHIEQQDDEDDDHDHLHENDHGMANYWRWWGKTGAHRKSNRQWQKNKKEFVHLLLSFSSWAAAVTRFYTLKSTNSFTSVCIYVCISKKSFLYMLRRFEM